jgi:flagellar biosynthesis protein FlhF
MDQPRWMLGEPEVEQAYFQLLAAEVDGDLAQQLLATAFKNAGADRVALRDAIAAEIHRCARVDSTLGVDAARQKRVALVGPPGAGKTASLAKIAIRYGIAERRSIALIAYDSIRLAAAEELRWYASILGVAFHAVETNLALAQAIEEHRGKDLILIDTPGFTARDLAAGSEEADYLARRDDIQKHLVLPVSMRASDMARTSAAFDVFRASRLIFTRLDESDVYGPMLCESARSGRPISFFGTGQRVPEDLDAANQQVFVERLLPAAPEQARRTLSVA